MPFLTATDGVKLYYEESGSGTPLVFVHEFAGDYRSWAPQRSFFARRYRCIVFNARGYTPSDVPENVSSYSQQRAADDILDVFNGLGLQQAHLCGLSMGGYASLHFTLQHPERVKAVVLAGAGQGSGKGGQEAFRRDVDATAQRMLSEGMGEVAKWYSRGPSRIQFEKKDPAGHQLFAEQLAEHSSLGSANTFLGVQRERPSVFDLQDEMAKMSTPALIMTGDEDDHVLEPAIMMKRTIPSATLCVLPNTGHTINLEEPDLFNRMLLDFFTLVDSGRWEPKDPRATSGSALMPAK